MIDKSHEMSEWESAIVTFFSTSRFGSIRRCNNCDAEHAKTVCVEQMHSELRVPCEAALAAVKEK